MTEQEEFKLPVKKTWIDVQKKTFTGWANSFLSERLLKIEDMETDLEDGVLLINLLEEISGKQIHGYNKKPKMRIQKVENNNKGIQFIYSEGLKLVGIGAEDIVDHKLKLILGLIWTLILRYQIQQGSGDDSPKKALLEWVNKQIAPYGLQVKNFTNDWQNGRALNALADSLSPGVLVKSRDLSQLSGDAFKDADHAMDVAEEQYEIPKILDPADLVELPEELSIITYVSYYRDWLENKAEKEKLRLLRAAHAGYCYAFGPGLEGAMSHEPAHFTIQAVNVYEDKLTHGGEHFDVKITRDGSDDTVVAEVKDKGDGTYPVTYTALLAGEYTINVTLHGEPIKDMPVHVKVLGADAANCNAYGPGLQGANVGKPAPFKIRARDGLGEPLKMGGDKFKVVITGPSDIGEVPVKDNNDGTYDVEYTPQKLGTYHIEITLRDEHISNSPLDVLCQAAVAAHSYAEGPGLEDGIRDHHPTHFTIHAVDIDGKPRKEGGDPFAVKIEGPDGHDVPTQLKDNSDGTYTVEYEPKKAGDYNVNVTLYDEPIKDMPKLVEVKASANAGASWADGPGLEQPKTYHPTHFTIHAIDHEGKPRTDGGDDFKVTINGPEKVEPKVHDNNDGTYTVEYEAKKAGDYQVDVTLEDAHIKDMPKTVNVKATPDPSKTYAEGPGLEEPNTHHEQTFTIHAVDHDGKPRNDGGDEFKVVLRGPEEIHPKVHDNNDGTYTVKYTAEKPGDYEVDVTYEDAHIKDMPRNVTIKPAPNAGKSYAEGPGLEKPNTHHEQTFTIHSIDHEGKPRTEGGDDFKVTMHGPAPVEPKLHDNNDGTYTVTYTATKAGDYEVDVTLESDHIKDMPRNVFVKASPDAGQSYAEGPGLEKPNTHHQQTFTIHAVDHEGKPRTDGGDEFKVVLRGPQEIHPDVHDNNDGTYTVKYTAEKSGDYEVDVTYEDAHIKDMPRNLFINASPDASKCYADGPGIEGGAPPVWQTRHEQTFTIHAVDHEGNPRKDGGDEFKVSINGPEQIHADVHDNDDGTYTVKYTPQQPGDYQIDVQYEGTSIKDLPKTVHILPSPDASQTWAEGPGITDGKVFDNEPTHFTIHAVGANGQEKKEGGDEFVVKISGVEDIPATVKDNNDGTYLVEYEPQEPGAYKIEVTYEGSHIKDSPFSINVKEGTDASQSRASFSITVQARDKRGNAKTFGGDTFTVQLVGGSKEQRNKADIETHDNGDGTYTANYTIEGEGSFKLAVKINGRHVDGSPFNQNRGVPKALRK